MITYRQGGDGMKLFESGRKQERRDKYSVFERDIPAGTFNLIQGGIVVIGLVINWILLVLLQDSIADLNPIIFGFIYIAIWIAGIVLVSEVPNTFVVCVAYYMIVAPTGILAASIIDLFSAKSGAEVVLQAVVAVTCVTAVVTCFAAIKPAVCDSLLTLAGIGSLGLVASILIVSLSGWEVSVWAWLASVFICFCFVYDMFHSQEFYKTVKNAVDCAVDIYLDTAFAIIKIPISLFGAYLETFPWFWR